MMLLLTHLLNLNAEWRQASLRLRTIVSSEDEKNPMIEKLKTLITELRIPAKCDVIIKKINENVIDIMHNSSKDANIVFLVLVLPENNSEEEFAENLDKLVVGFNSTILVRNAESIQGELIE